MMRPLRLQRMRFGSVIWPVAVLFALVVALAPTAAIAQAAPVVDSFAATPNPVLPGATVNLTLQAHDPDCASTCTSGCGAYIRADLTGWSATGGTFLSTDRGTSASPYTTSAIWQAPSVEGTYTVTVNISDSGTWMCGNRQSASASIPIQVSSVINAAPVIESLSAAPAEIFVGETAALAAVASDPDGDPVTYSWAADLGSVTPGSPGTATFQAATYPGVATVTLTVTDDKGAPAVRTVAISVTSIRPDKTLVGLSASPHRLAGDAYGFIYATDADRLAVRVINLETGEVARTIPVPGVTAVAVDWLDQLVVGTAQGVRLMSREGALLRSFAAGPGTSGVQDVAVDGAGQRYAVLYRDINRVVVYGASGAELLAFGETGSEPGTFRSASCLTVGPTGEFFVGDATTNLISVFDANGLYLRQFGGRGNHSGEFLQLLGLASGNDGAVYATDSFLSRVQVFESDGSLREVFGKYGDGLGRLKTPVGICVVAPFGKVLVASLNAGEIQVYNLEGATAPPANTPPSAPVPIEPVEGAQIPRGSPVILEVLNGTDPDFQPLQAEFELYELVQGALALSRSWSIPQGLGTTAVDASAEASKAGTFAWRARAWDGKAYSPWSVTVNFQVINGQPNRPPGTPIQTTPIGAAEVPDLTPALTLLNTLDPDGNALSYRYEAALAVDGTLQTVAASPAVLQDASGTTAWSVPSGALGPSQEAYWRASAFDGLLSGSWTGYEAFWTPPFAVPQEGEFGLLPGGDRTRPAEVRYEIGPASADTPLYFQVYNIGEFDLEVDVNGNATYPVPGQTPNAWSTTVAVTLSAADLHPDAANRVRFVRKAGSGDWGVRKVALVAPSPAAPALSAAPYNTVVDLSWPAAQVPAGASVKLYRAPAPGGPFTEVAIVAPGQSLYRDTGLDNEVTYYYRASYVRQEEGEGISSATVSARPVGDFGPTPITDLRVVRSGSDLILTWTPVTSSPALLNYEVYRDLQGSWAPDTETFGNLLQLVGALSGTLAVPGDAGGADALWYSILPIDTLGRRAAP